MPTCLADRQVFCYSFPMSPEERQLLERSLKLSQENNEILRRIDARAKRAAIYGFIKLAIVILPFVIGYFILEPYFGQALKNFQDVQGLLNSTP